MKAATNKIKTTVIALLLTLAISSLVAYLPIASAAEYDMYAFLSVTPSTVGINQQLQITMWLSMPPPTIAEFGPMAAQSWHGLTVEVTTPSGTETLGPFNTESTGSTYTLYTPSEVGTYTFQLTFPGERKNGTAMGVPVDDYYKPDTTPKVTVTVQEEPIASYPDTPLPSDYWARPINSENQLWGSISGNWLLERYDGQGNAFNSYTTAPNTAHIVWTKELTFGGIAGGEFGDQSYYEGHVYENKFNPPVIINGRLYYNEPDPPANGFYCVDLRTGETLFYSDTSNPSGSGYFWSSGSGTGGITCGQLLQYDSVNQHGVYAYLWSLGSTYTMYNAFTGQAILSFDGIPLQAQYIGFANPLANPAITFDEKGNLLVYVLDGTNNWLLLWNSTKAVNPTNAASWRPISGTYDWSNGIEWNVTVPDLEGAQSWNNWDSPVTPVMNDEILLATTWSYITGDPDGQITEVAYSREDGHQLWYQNRTVTPGTTSFASRGPINDGVYFTFLKETMQWYAYDINTGNLKWGPSKAYTSAWGMYQQGGVTAAYGTLYAEAFDGMIHAYDIKTGNHLWDYSTGDAGYETPYGTWPFYGVGSAVTVADGKLYAGTNEHSASMPLWRGGGLHCVNATTGDLVWKIKGWYWTPVIADGYIVSANGADNRIYCFGKGQTATTVSASPEVSVYGNSVLIKGTVLDESTGAAGTAAIADEYMTEWMEYLYMQQSYPDNATGVEVSLDVVDANGNFRNIGTVTSDANGVFSYAWTPDIPGKYTVYATFAGSESYWQSSAENAFTVDEAPVATPEPTPAPQSAADMYFIPMSIGIIIAIIIVGILVVLMSRKR